MSMTIYLYQNNSSPETVSKSLTLLATLSGTLRDGADIMEPSILIEDTGLLSGANYCYIPEFGRYYYITNITKVRNGLSQLDARRDVLMTYSNQIRAQRAVVRRQENRWNLYLDDGIFKSYSNPMILCKSFPAGFSDWEFVLSVAGGQ